MTRRFIGCGIVATLAAVLLPMIAHAQTSCDVEMLKAIRTYKTVSDKATIDQAAREIYCNKTNNSAGLNYSDLNIDVKKAEEACKSNKSTFFQENAHDILLSYVPPEAIDAVSRLCRPTGLTFSLAENNDGVALSATWSGVGGIATATIEGLTYPRKLFDCSHTPFTRGSVLKTTTKVGSCQRRNPGNATFILHTNRGDAVAMLQAPRKKPVYVLTLGTADDQMSCDLNENKVAGASINSAPPPVDLSALLRPGQNHLICRPHDDHPDGNFNPCWQYSFTLTRDGKVISAPRGNCCGSNCAKQPDPVSLSIDY